ncbi:MAG: bifunctional lysylphosphatidylglycerol flippase/synthetase MprF [Myxococcales bacterium]|nr:bifunctional lysylphosphatidylglycerol flippase/synthetase MprF [Myxococcales bacterium]MDH5566045.1 bifunctional lysylphosphatidylglycerol flippase/synthetase MprF [Myxococcales bacterium]
MKERILSIAGSLLGLALFGLAVVVLHHELRTTHLESVLRHVRAISSGHLLAALSAAALGYLALTGYDALAFRYVGNRLVYRRIALSSFVAFVFSHNVGLSFFGGSAVRYRMLSSWGVRVDEIARIVVFNFTTFWLGFLAVSGVAQTLRPIPFDLAWLPLSTSRPIGVAFLCALGAVLLAMSLRRAPIEIRGLRIAMTGLPMTAAQVLVSSADWLLAASVLYAVLPEAPGLDFGGYLAAYLLSQILGLISHVPGGLGVFESAMLLLLGSVLPGDRVLASILVYRVIYYLLPMGVAATLFGAYELHEGRRALRRTGDWILGWAPELVPHLLALTTFFSGVLLLVSGAMPELPERLEWLRLALPLPVLEISKLLGSVIGVFLLLLASALRQRIDAAYFGTLGLLFTGALVSLLKGLNYEEALILGAMALLLLPCRTFFFRKSSLLTQPLSGGWWVTVGIVAVGALLVLDLAYRHVEYSNELWWQFGVDAQAPRSLRAMLAAGLALLGIGSMRLLRPAPAAPPLPTSEDLDRAQAITARNPRGSGYLALLGDKQILFHENGNAFLMFGTAGRTWVSMGDPIGNREEQEALGWRFREMADRHGARPVFYEVSAESLPIYLELGLELRKLGEEGRVPLQSFSLEGSARRGLRHAHNRMRREGSRFQILAPNAVPAVLDLLEEISNAWLADRNTAEKRFSLGCFDRAYLSRLPVAVILRNERIVAFANLWTTDAKQELSIDLMRYAPEAPGGVMEHLFIELMLWGRSEGYRYFNLGMSPLAGMAQHRGAPLWNRLGAFLFRHGEHFYNFRGLRSFKDKFDPEWEPRYLASSGGLNTPLVLTHIASLIAGSAAGVVAKG